MKKADIKALLVQKARNTYGNTKALSKALTGLIKKASGEELKGHLEQLKEALDGQLTTVERVLTDLEQKPRGITADYRFEESINAIVNCTKNSDKGENLDLEVIMGLQAVGAFTKVELTNQRNFAELLGMDNAAENIQEVLDAVVEFDENLNELVVSTNVEEEEEASEDSSEDAAEPKKKDASADDED